jgi:aminodeoxyfutalosine synthase
MMRLYQRALTKGASGERLSGEEVMALADNITPETVHELGEAALANRRARCRDKATYIINMHVNPSNVCENHCSFCTYSAKYKDDHAYSLNEDEIFRKVDSFAPTEVHIVGGLNHHWDYKRNLGFVKECRRRYPDIFIKVFTAVEIEYFARREKAAPHTVLEELRGAGLNAMPGGGAEIFSKRMQKILFPEKIGAETWLHIHKIAHKLSFPTNATMLFGFGESPAERVEHLLRLRDTQDETGGFVCFIPLAFQPTEEKVNSSGRWGQKMRRFMFTNLQNSYNKLRLGREDWTFYKTVKSIKQSPPPIEILSLIAISRLILDNIPHIKAYWPMIGLETAAAALSWGADDLDGTLVEEKIAHATGCQTPVSLTSRQMEETISLGGFIPVERDGRFLPKHREVTCIPLP